MSKRLKLDAVQVQGRKNQQGGKINRAALLADETRSSLLFGCGDSQFVAAFVFRVS